MVEIQRRRMKPSPPRAMPSRVKVDPASGTFFRKDSSRSSYENEPEPVPPTPSPLAIAEAYSIYSTGQQGTCNVVRE